MEATGHAPAGIAHARRAIAEGKHVVMVNVEADVLAGVALAREAERAGVVYSLAYGDQPALICEMVDWARACGFGVIAAGKGTKYLPEYHASTPATVWGYYGLTEEQARIGGMNPQMFNSFLDGTKSGIEMAAVANATGLMPPRDGLGFPPCGTHEMAELLRPAGQVEVVSSLHRDGTPVANDLRWGVYVLFEAPNEYTARCFKEYGVVTDASGRMIRAVPPIPSDRAGAEYLDPVRSAAWRGNRRTDWLPRQMWCPPQSETCARVRYWTAKAAAASGASCCPRAPAWKSVACRSGWRTTLSWCATCVRGSAFHGPTCALMRRIKRTAIGGRWSHSQSHTQFVMAGLVPAIHASPVKPGHDEQASAAHERVQFRCRHSGIDVAKRSVLLHLACGIQQPGHRGAIQ